MAYIGKTPVIGNFVKLDAISVVNGQAAYTMQNGGANFTEYSNVNQFLVSLNGILQSPTDSFTVSGSTITFASNLVTGDIIDFIIVLGNTLDVGVPSDNTVSLAKLTATGTKDATTFLRGDNTFASAGGTNTPAFMVYRSTTQTISDNTGTKVLFQTEVFDSDSAYDNATNYRFTVPSGQAGKYLFGYGIMGITNTTGRFNADIFKNGTNGFAYDEINYTQYDTLGKTAVLDLSVGDYIEVYVTQISGGNLDLYSAGQGRTYFFGYKIIE